MKLLISALALLLLVGCAAPQEKDSVPNPAAEYRKLTPEEAHAMMAEGGVTVVDVRTSEEFAEGHIENALLVPNEEIGSERPAQLPDADATLLVYCRSGRRSKQASEKLLALGYTNVYDFGGINDWPYAVVKD